jgi:hypothetical protein
LLGEFSVQRTVITSRDSIREQGLAWLGKRVEKNEGGVATLRYLLGELDERAVSAIQRDHAQDRPERCR